MVAGKKISIFIFLLFTYCLCMAQQDSLRIDTTGTIQITAQSISASDTVTQAYQPRVAIIRSAIIPGWGQITNKKYWKVPIVYGALGTSTYLFFRNLKQFKESRLAYRYATDGIASNDELIPEPYYSVRSQPQRIATFRNQVRQNMDYSVLFFLVFWGLNVADAAVDAHLKTFDVSDDLSLGIKPGYSPLSNTTGVSLVLHIGK